MFISLRRLPAILFVLLQLCSISNVFVAAAGGRPSPKVAVAKKDKSTPGSSNSGYWPPPRPLNPSSDPSGSRRRLRPPPGNRPQRPAPPPPPPLPVWRPGHVIGARAKYYEPNSKVTTMHPGVIVAGPDSNGNFKVAMISNKLLGNGPRQAASKYLQGDNGGIEGEISLGMPTIISGQYLRPWKRQGLGDTPPLPAEKLAELKKDINTATHGYAGLTRRSLVRRARRTRRALRSIQ